MPDCAPGERSLAAAPAESLGRSASPAALLDAVTPHTDALGITRIANITGLDYLGIPVYTAVRPQSRNFTVVQGKGLTHALARLGCFCEALESFCSEAPRFPTRLMTAAEAARDGPVLVPGQRARRPLAADAVVSWAEATCLFTGSAMLVPAEVALSDFATAPRPGFGHFWPTTNGVAAGADREEAVLHAVCELIERDAFAHFAARRSLGRPVTAVDLGSAPDWLAARLLAPLLEAGIAVELFDMTTDIGVPAFACVIDDAGTAREPFLGRFSGSGCHPDPGVAAARAIIEAVQCRLTLIAGARDDIAESAYLTVAWGRSIAKQLERPFAIGDRVGLGHGGAPAPPSATSAAAAVAGVLDRLAAIGVERLCVIDLCSPVAPLVCVRVVADGLEGMIDKPGYRPGPRLRRMIAADA